MICFAYSLASAGVFANFTPPPLPRPPAWIWAFTTTGVPNSSAMISASAGVSATFPFGTATPYFDRTAFAWYSWIFISSGSSRLVCDQSDPLRATVSEPEPIDRLAKLLDRRRRLLQRLGLVRGQLELDDFLHSAGAELGRQADEEAVAPVVLPARENRAGEDHLLVQQDRFAHLDRRGRGGVVCRPRLQQGDDLGAALRRPLEDLRQPVPGDEVFHRDAGHGGVLCGRDHRVAMAAQDEGRHVAHGDAQLHGDEGPEPGRIEDPRHAHHLVGRKLAVLGRHVGHGVEGIRHDDEQRLGGFGDRPEGHVLHDPRVDLEEVVAAHPRLARQSRRDDDDLGTGRLLVPVGPGDLAVVPVDRAGLHQVERLPLRHPLHDVDEHDVADVPLGQPLRGRRPDVSRADDRDLFPAHRALPVDGIKLLKVAISSSISGIIWDFPGKNGRRFPPNLAYRIQRSAGCQEGSRHSDSSPAVSTDARTRSMPRRIFSGSRIRRRPRRFSNRSTVAIVSSATARRATPFSLARASMSSFGATPPVSTTHTVSVSSAASWISVRCPPVTTAFRESPRKIRRACSTSIAPTQNRSIIAVPLSFPPHTTDAERESARARTLTLPSTGSEGTAPSTRNPRAPKKGTTVSLTNFSCAGWTRLKTTPRNLDPRASAAARTWSIDFSPSNRSRRMTRQS